MFRNAGLLLGGKAVGALFRLGALALTARGLGAELFGVLVLINTFTLAIAEFVKFQSWQAVVRYGALALHENRRTDFQALLKFTLLLDLIGAACGVFLAAIAAPFAGRYLGWPPSASLWASLYAFAAVFMATATPTGVLRLCGRFDLIALQGSLVGLARLIGAAGAFAAGGGLVAFLAVWFFAHAVGGAAFAVFTIRELRRRDLLRGMDRSLRGLAPPHVGVWRFVWTTNFNTTLGMAANQFAVLAVGWMLGPSAAGMYRVARSFADVFAKPVGLLAPAIYPEFAKLTARGRAEALGRLAVRSAVVAGCAAAPLMLLLALAGRTLLRLTVGPDFVAAYDVMILLSVAAATTVAAFPLEPLVMAIGREGRAFQVRLLATAVYVPLLLILLHQVGVIGAGVAAILYSLVLVTGLGIAAAPWLKRGDRRSERPVRDGRQSHARTAPRTDPPHA